MWGNKWVKLAGSACLIVLVFAIPVVKIQVDKRLDGKFIGALKSIAEESSSDNIVFVQTRWEQNPDGTYYKVEEELPPEKQKEMIEGKRAIDRLAKELKELEEERNENLRRDKYGGTTPEKTWEMFVSALKEKDFKLASKYFILDKQEEAKEFLKDLVKSDALDGTIKEYESGIFENPKYPGHGYYDYYSAIEQDGKILNFASPIKFKENEFSGVWKIEEL